MQNLSPHNQHKLGSLAILFSQKGGGCLDWVHSCNTHSRCRLVFSVYWIKKPVKNCVEFWLNLRLFLHAFEQSSKNSSLVEFFTDRTIECFFTVQKDLKVSSAKKWTINFGPFINCGSTNFPMEKINFKKEKLVVRLENEVDSKCFDLWMKFLRFYQTLLILLWIFKVKCCTKIH